MTEIQKEEPENNKNEEKKDKEAEGIIEEKKEKEIMPIDKSIENEKIQDEPNNNSVPNQNQSINTQLNFEKPNESKNNIEINNNESIEIQTEEVIPEHISLHPSKEPSILSSIQEKISDKDNSSKNESKANQNVNIEDELTKFMLILDGYKDPLESSKSDNKRQYIRLR